MDQAEQLRKMMQQSESKPKARVITVTSGKGGVGKTSISINLAVQLTRLGKRVVVFDADFGLANIEVMLGVRPKYNLADMMFRGKDLADIITQGEEGISFISGGSGIQELASMNREQVMLLTSRLIALDKYADVIIVDTGAGISDSVLEFVLASTEVLLVATPEPTSITDAYALLKALNRKTEFVKEHTSIKMISNRVKNDAEGQNVYEKMSVVSEKFLNIPITYLGPVPMDEQISKAVMRQKPVSVINPDAPASKAIKQIAEKLLELETEEISDKRGMFQLFSNLIRNRMTKK
ncbi:MAG: MinD/ParA family protein [Lachnospiraceae bacterium]|nr:MinD/ParA family protein [Lachnospiraceae bacterium]